MNILWTALARRDLRGHREYLVERNVEAALALDEGIRGAVALLAEYPYRGHPGRRDRTRELVTGGWPYVVIYAATDAPVIILHVLHTSQDRPLRWPGMLVTVLSAHPRARG